MTTKRRGLGRNLEALLGGSSYNNVSEAAQAANLQQIPLKNIEKGKYQPRREFPQHALDELAKSIMAQGVIQPIVVRSIANNRYEIVAGERRFRAAKLAGLDDIPAIVRELPDEAAIAMALIENIQREDLNPIEEALALQRLINEFDMTHEQVANAVGKSRTAVSNLLRLLALTDDVKRLLEQGKLEMGHARCLLALNANDQLHAADIIIAKDLSVRETEHLVRRLLAPKAPSGKQNSHELSPHLHAIQHELTQKLKTHVYLQQNAKGRGKLIIKYKNEQQLQEVLNKIS